MLQSKKLKLIRTGGTIALIYTVVGKEGETWGIPLIK